MTVMLFLTDMIYKWNKYTDNIISKANNKLGFLKRNLKVKDTNLKESGYKAIVRPTLEYYSTV